MPRRPDAGQCRTSIARRMPFRPISRPASPPANMICRRRRAITRKASRTIRAMQQHPVAGLLLCHHLRAISRARANMPAQIVAKSPDERSARLALAVIAFKHKDYAEARKQLVALRQGTVSGPGRVAVRWLGRGRQRRCGRRHGRHEDSLAARSGAEGLAAFHTALIADYLGRPRGGRRIQEGAGCQPRQPARDPGLWPFSGTGGPGTRTRKRFTRNLERRRRCADRQGRAGAHCRATRSPSLSCATPEDGAAEGAVRHGGLADRRGRAPISPFSICAWRFICGPTWRLASSAAGRPFRSPGQI